MMKVGIYGCRPRNHAFPIFAWLVMIGQFMNPFRSNSYSHMVIRFQVGGFDLVIHSTAKTGVRIDSFSDFLENYKIIWKKKIEINTTREKFSEWIEQVDLKKYDKLSIVGHFFSFLGLKKASQYGNGLTSLICCELVIEMLIIFRGLKIVDSDVYDLNKTKVLLNDFS